MAVDNKKIAQDVLAAVGGKENVAAATHCITRLRLNLKNEALAEEETVKKIPGVLTVVKSGGQYQVVIGQNVPKVYAAFCDMTGLETKAAIDENLDGAKQKLTPKQIGGNVLNYISGSMTPLIPAMLSAGLCKALATILGPSLLNVISDTSDTYILLNFIYNAFFYYLPIQVGYNAAQKMKIPATLGAFMGGILVVPAFMQMVKDGTPFTILGINATMVDYSQSVVPVLLSVAFIGFLYAGSPAQE